MYWSSHGVELARACPIEPSEGIKNLPLETGDVVSFGEPGELLQTRPSLRNAVVVKRVVALSGVLLANSDGDAYADLDAENIVVRAAEGIWSGSPHHLCGARTSAVIGGPRLHQKYTKNRCSSAVPAVPKAFRRYQ